MTEGGESVTSADDSLNTNVINVPYVFADLRKADDTTLWDLVKEPLATAESIPIDIWLELDGTPGRDAAKIYAIKSLDGHTMILSHREYVTSKGDPIVQTFHVTDENIRIICARIEEDIYIAQERIRFYDSAIQEGSEKIKQAVLSMEEAVAELIDMTNTPHWYKIPEVDLDKFPTIHDDKKLDTQAFLAVFSAHPELIISYPRDYDGDTQAQALSYLRVIPALSPYGQEMVLEYFDLSDQHGYQCDYLPDDVSVFARDSEFNGYRTSIHSLKEAISGAKRGLLLLRNIQKPKEHN